MSTNDFCGNFDTTYGNVFAGVTFNTGGGHVTFGVPNRRGSETETGRLHNRHFLVPRDPDTTFTGREDVLSKMRKSCLPSADGQTEVRQKRLVLYGAGGSGKTQLCLKFAEEQRESFWGIFWVDSSNRTNIDSAFNEIGRMCGIGEDITNIKRWLVNSQNRWLLIFDNADDPNLDLSQYFPAGARGTILITTRNQHCDRYASVGQIHVDTLSPEEAIELFYKTSATPQHRDVHTWSGKDVLHLVRTLGFFAQAISQAGAYVKQGQCTISEYIGALSRQKTELLKIRAIQRKTDYEYTAHAAWEISVASIQAMPGKAASDALELLEIFGFFHHEDIGEEVFHRAWITYHSAAKNQGSLFRMPRLLRSTTNGQWNAADFRSALQILDSYSLIIRSSARSLSMHPLIHTWARDRLETDRYRQALRTSVAILALSIPTNQSMKSVPYLRSIIPHTETIVRHLDLEAPTGDLMTAETIEHISQFRLVFQCNGKFSECLELSNLILDASKSIYGENNLKTLQAISWVAKCLLGTCSWANALLVARKLHDDYKRMRGPKDRLTLETFGIYLQAFHRLAPPLDVITLQEKHVKDCKRAFGERDPLVLDGMANLAYAHSAVGQDPQARVIIQEMIGKRRRVDGELSLDFYHHNYRLGDICWRVGEFHQARVLLEEVAQVYTRFLGEKHPRTLGSRSSLGITYGGLGRVQESINLLETVLEDQTLLLGEQSPDTVSTMERLAHCYAQDGRLDDAKYTQESVVVGYKQIYGKHMNTARAIGDLAFVCYNTGEVRRGYHLMEQSSSMYTELAGSNHHTTLYTMRVLRYWRLNSPGYVLRSRKPSTMSRLLVGMGLKSSK